MWSLYQGTQVIKLQRSRIIMYSCIRPTQYVREHYNDYLIFKGNRFYIHTRFAGVVEITKEEYERLEKQGMEIR